MNTEPIQQLREPAAWTLLAAVVMQMFAGVIGLFPYTPATMVSQGGTFFGPVTVGIVVLAVVLMITAPRKSPRTFAFVLAALIVLGVGALYGLLTLIASWPAASSVASGASSFFSAVGRLGILGLAGFFLYRVFMDHQLVPRPAQQPAASGVPPVGQPYGVANQTGAQQSFAAPDPNLTGQGYQTGGQSVYGQADPGLTGQGYQTGGQSVYGQADPGLTGQGYQTGGQGAYGQQPAGQTGQGYQTGGQSVYGQADPGLTGQGYQTGGQSVYGQADPGLTGQGYQTGGQGAYGQQPTAYQDPYGQAQPSSVQPTQQGYDQGYGQAGYATSAQQPYTGAQDWSQTGQQAGHAQYGQYQQGDYGQQEQQQPYPSQTGYGAYDSQAAQGTGGQDTYGQAGYHSTGGSRPAYGSAPDDEATLVQGMGPLPGSGEDRPVSSEHAATEAIQHGWYQQPGGEEQRTEQAEGESRAPREEPMDLPKGWYRDEERR